MDQRPERNPLPLAILLTVIGVVLTVAVFVFLVSILGGEGAGEPDNTIGGRSLTLPHPGARTT